MIQIVFRCDGTSDSDNRMNPCGAVETVTVGEHSVGYRVEGLKPKWLKLHNGRFMCLECTRLVKKWAGKSEVRR